jgi:trehalose 6-phosphate synthase
MVRASAIPISVDFSELDELAGTPEVIARATKIRASLGDPKILMLGMDRLDYTKGIRHRLKA